MLLMYDADTVALLRATLEEAWASLRAHEKAGSSKTLLASHILELASRGERNPIRLRTYALVKYEMSRSEGASSAKMD
jgi:hypothetical protein